MTDARPLIVLASPIHPDGRALLETEARVVVSAEPKTEPVLALMRDAQGVLFRGGPRCDEAFLAASPRLRVVGRHGVGLDTVDIPACTRHGVAVVHAPGSNSQAVAEHALALMLACVKHTRRIDQLTRKGDWSPRFDVRNVELGGRTLGIVGIGNIGRRVAKFAGALGMRVLAYDPYLPDDEVRRRGAEPQPSLEAMLPQVDVLTCHTPLTPETQHMINEKTLGLLKPGTIFVNTSRGGVQSEPDLFRALVTGHLASAGLDVFEQEPSPIDNPIFNLDNVVVSTHIAGVTKEANRTAALQVAGEMLRVLRGEHPDVLVNREVWPRPASPR